MNTPRPAAKLAMMDYTFMWTPGRLIMNRIFVVLTVVVLWLYPSRGYADEITFSFTGAVEEYRKDLGWWDVKGLPFTDGDPMSGEFSYTSGLLPVDLNATLSFKIVHQSFVAENVGDSAVNVIGDGSHLRVVGFLPDLDAMVGVIFQGDTSIFGGCVDLGTCLSEFIPLPSEIDLSSGHWSLKELQIRGPGSSFGTHV